MLALLRSKWIAVNWTPLSLKILKLCKVEFMEEFTLNPKHPAFSCTVVTQAACEYELRPFAARG